MGSSERGFSFRPDTRGYVADQTKRLQELIGHFQGVGHLADHTKLQNHVVASCQLLSKKDCTSKGSTRIVKSFYDSVYKVYGDRWRANGRSSFTISQLTAGLTAICRARFSKRSCTGK